MKTNKQTTLVDLLHSSQSIRYPRTTLTEMCRVRWIGGMGSNNGAVQFSSSTSQLIPLVVVIQVADTDNHIHLYT